MKNLVRALALTAIIGLAACASISNPFTQSRIDTLNASWGAALVVADGYYSTCEKRLIPSSCRTVVNKMQSAASIVHPKVKKAREYAKNPTISSTDLIAIASSAVDDFKNLQTTLGVK